MQYNVLLWMVTLITAVTCQHSLVPYYSTQQLISPYEGDGPSYEDELLNQQVVEEPQELDKRKQNFQFGLGKRQNGFGFGLGKRQSFGFGLGKRGKSYEFGLGKRYKSGNYEFGLGKRSYQFGLGKREPGFAFGLGKRPAGYQFGLGKRDVYSTYGEQADLNDDLNKEKPEISEEDPEMVVASVQDDEEAESTRHKREIQTESHYDNRLPRSYSFGLGKKSDQYLPVLDNYLYNYYQQQDKPKQSRSYAFGLGKRSTNKNNNFGFGLGKRSYDESDIDDYSYPDSKRHTDYAFGLGKRGGSNAYTFGLGKRDDSYDDQAAYSDLLQDDTEKRSGSYAFGLGKRLSSYQFGLGKRTKTQFPYFSFGKRPANKMNFGLGKRSYSFLQEPYDSFLNEYDLNAYIKRALLLQKENQVPDINTNYHFGLGKRDVSNDKSYAFGLGKKMDSSVLTTSETDHLTHNKDSTSTSNIKESSS